MKRIIVYVIVGILFVNFFTFWMFSDRLLFEKIIENEEIETSTESIYIIGLDDKFYNSTEQKEVAENRFLTKGFSNVFFDSSKKFNKKLKPEYQTFYSIELDDSNLLSMKVNEIFFVHGDDEYFVQTWESKYIWILFRWYLINRNQTSIS